MDGASLATRLRELTGFDEEWAAAQGRPSNAVAASHALLSRCLAAPGDSHPPDVDVVRALTLAERDWLLLEMRQRSLGSRIVGEVACVACGRTAEVRFSARDVGIEPRPRPPDPTHTLPSGRMASLQTITAGDHEWFAEAAEEDPRRQQALAIMRGVRSIDGVPIVDSLDTLSPADVASLAVAVESLIPEGLRLDTTCEGCGRPLSAFFDVPAFVVSELREHSRTLLDDVHTIALAYHWSEPDILALPLRRRLAYLTRLEAERDRALVGGEYAR